MTERDEINAILAKRLAELPQVVRDAITSTDVEKHLRDLSESHKLHFDQWQRLENEVMMTLLGFEPVEALEKNIRREVGVSEEVAHALATDIASVVFDPIRKELERLLAHPEAEEKAKTGTELVREQMLAQEGAPQPVSTPTPVPTTPVTPLPIPATPPVVRAPASGAYKPGETSVARKSVEDDPYREPIQ